MMSRQLFRLTMLLLSLAIGGTLRAEDKNGNGDKNGKNGKDDNGKESKKWTPPKTLFTWNIGRPVDDDEDKDDDEENGQEEPLKADRPDFTESSTTVGRGRIQLEMGYTYTRDRENGVSRREHNYPEALLRIGMFADWFEFRIGQNFGNERVFDSENRTRADGADDLYLGVRFALTEQKDWLPEMALTPQMRVPTGSRDRTDDQVLPGLVLTYSWELKKDCLSLAMLTGVNRANDGSGDFYAEFTQTASLGFALTEKMGVYTEWFGFMPHGAREALPEHYFNSGITYLLTNNIQFDVRAGVGLNRSADDFFVGTGLVLRH